MGTKGLIYLAGVTLDGKTGRLIEYNPSARTWRLRADMPTARTSFGIAAPGNGAIYVFGGRVSPCCDGVHGDGGLTVVERFDPATNTWRQVHSMPVGDAAPGAVAASAPIPPGSEEGIPQPSGSNPMIYVFLAARAWAYDPAADTWTAGPANPSFGMTGSPVVGVDGIVRVFNCDRYDLYDPFNTHWQTGQFFPSASCGVLAVAGVNANVYVFGGDYLPSPGRSVLAFYAGGG
jgi:N-acetylneuraminic acid mutarotase